MEVAEVERDEWMFVICQWSVVRGQWSSVEPSRRRAVVPIANCETERKAGGKNGDLARNLEKSWLGWLGGSGSLTQARGERGEPRKTRMTRKEAERASVRGGEEG
jgi:hypothetical protein